MTPIDSSGPKIGVAVNSIYVSFAGTELCHFEVFIGCNAKFSTFAWLLRQQGSFWGKFK